MNFAAPAHGPRVKRGGDTARVVSVCVHCRFTISNSLAPAFARDSTSIARQDARKRAGGEFRRAEHASSSRALNSGARAGPSSLFSVPSHEGMERREAPPADRRRLANPNPGSAARHGRSPVTRGCRFRARWPSDVGPGASRRSNAMPLSGTAPCSAFERRDRRTPSIEQGRTYLNSYRINVKIIGKNIMTPGISGAVARRCRVYPTSVLKNASRASPTCGGSFASLTRTSG